MRVTTKGAHKRAIIHKASRATGRVLSWKAARKWLKRQVRAS